MLRPLMLVLLLTAGCDDPSAAPLLDAGPADLGPAADAERDSRAPDARPPDAVPPDALPPDGPPSPDASREWPESVRVLVLRDGVPSPDTLVMQGGATAQLRTGPDGRAEIPLDLDVAGQVWVLASHPRARIRAAQVRPPVPEEVTIELTTFDASDNPAYRFQDPGTPERRNTTAQCAHCHRTIGDAWWDSAHRQSASNPHVRSLAAEADARGACADCHAPGIDGGLGGRALDEAEGVSLEGGVHCDVCHRVESIDEAAPAGVGGRLRMVRPSEDGSPSLGAGGLLPLTFGPHHDSPNVKMGSVQRDHFADGRLCVGCHEHTQPVLVVGAAIDPERWPERRLPIHTTVSEHRSGALGEATTCNSCHMPPDASVANAADWQLFPLADLGVQGGWLRPAGEVRSHAFVGPRTKGARILQLAASLMVSKEVADGVLRAEVTVRNASAGHALPTGEPARSVLLEVHAFCGEEALTPTGGDALPGWAGAVASKGPGEDWSEWPDAQPGDRLRVVRSTGAWHDYPGVSPFDGWSPEEKGLPVREVVGEVEVTAVEGGVVTTATPLPAGDEIHLVRGPDELAGAPGFAFARVLLGVDGEPMVPHHRAVDVRSDNRLMPQASWRSTHTFAAPCPDPEVRARLLHRPFSLALRRARGWETADSPMAEVRR